MVRETIERAVGMMADSRGNGKAEEGVEEGGVEIVRLDLIDLIGLDESGCLGKGESYPLRASP